MDTTKTIWHVCTSLSIFFLCTSFILTLRYYKQIGSHLRFFILLLLLGLSTEIFSFVYMKILNNTNNLFVIPIYYILEFFILSCLYLKHFFKKTNWIGTSLIVLIQVVLCIEGYRSMYFDQVYSFHAYGKVLVNLVAVIYSLKFFLNLAQGSAKINPSKVGLNIIIFVYYVLSLILFIFINFLVNGDSTITMYFWIFHSSITALFYFSISFLIWKVGTTRKLSLFGY